MVQTCVVQLYLYEITWYCLQRTRACGSPNMCFKYFPHLQINFNADFLVNICFYNIYSLTLPQESVCAKWFICIYSTTCFVFKTICYRVYNLFLKFFCEGIINVPWISIIYLLDIEQVKSSNGLIQYKLFTYNISIPISRYPNLTYTK